VRGLAVNRKRFLILVLLVDHDHVGIIFQMMRNVVDAPRFLAGFGGQQAHSFRHLSAIFGGKGESDNKADHSSNFLFA